MTRPAAVVYPTSPHWRGESDHFWLSHDMAGYCVFIGVRYGGKPPCVYCGTPLRDEGTNMDCLVRGTKVRTLARKISA